MISMRDEAWSTRLRRHADQIAARFGERHDLDALLLYGSVARGDARADSDIDLLLLGPDCGQTIAALRTWIATVDPERRAGLAFHTRESFAELIHDGSRFLVHLRREGEVLIDRTGQLEGFLRAPWEPVSVDEEIAIELARLANYDRPELFGGRFLFPLAHVFTIGKAVVMARLADDGIFEFNRRRAFFAFERRFPAVARDVRVVAALEPFVALTRRHTASLPFSPSGPGAAERLEASVAAVRRIASVGS
jgi:predicted nucleotidyltransferase